MAGLSSLGAGLLLLALCACCVLPTGSVVVPSSCCLSFTSKFPERRVVAYQLTSQSVCPVEGVIFTTRRGQKFCADPKMLWVQRYMKKLDARKKKVTARTRHAGRRARNQRRPANSTSV